MASGTELITYTASLTGADLIYVNQITPIAWIAIPPRGGVAIPNLNVSVMSAKSSPVSFQAAGWYEVAGYVISNTNPLSSNLQQYTARQLVDDFIHKIEAPEFGGANNQITDKEMFKGVDQAVGPNAESNIANPDSPAMQGEEVQTGIKKNVVLSHPAVYDAAQELGLGATQVYHYSSNLGAPWGKSTPIDENTVMYQDSFNVSLDMVRSGGMYNFFVLVASLPEFGAAKTDEEVGNYQSGGLSTMEPIAPWSDWGEMINMFNKAPLLWTDSMLDNEVFNSNKIPEEFKELIRWKRQYRVPPDTWQNSDMRYFIKGDMVLTYPCEIFRKHI